MSDFYRKSKKSAHPTSRKQGGVRIINGKPKKKHPVRLPTNRMTKESTRIRQIVDLYITSTLPEEVAGSVQMWLTSGVHAEEKSQALEDVYHRIDAGFDKEAYRSLESVWDKLGFPEEAKCGMNELRAAEVGHERPVARKVSLRRTLLRAAAVLFPVLLVAGAAYYFVAGRPDNTPQTAGVFVPDSLVTGASAEGEINLADSSRVLLNSNSMLVYTDHRQAKLTGEGYFEIARDQDSPFVLTTENTVITVLGTGFNVEAYPGARVTTVTLYHGSVRFEAGGSALTLEPGQSASFDNATGQITVSDAEASRPEWIASRLNFDNEPMSDVFRALEWYYGVEIDWAGEPCANSLVSFVVYGDESIDTVMSNLSAISGDFGCEINGKRIKIKTR